MINTLKLTALIVSGLITTISISLGFVPFGTADHYSRHKITKQPWKTSSVAMCEVMPKVTHDNFTVSYEVNSYSQVSIAITDFTGRIVDQLLDKEFAKGKYQSTFDISDKYVPGYYFVRTTSNGKTSASKIQITE